MALNKCHHTNVQQFTEVCLNCGRNIYESDEEYAASLRRDIEQKRRELREFEVERLKEERDRLDELLRQERARKDPYNPSEGGW